MRLTEKIKTATSRSNYHTQFAKMSFDEIVDLTTDVLFFHDTVGLGLNVYLSVDGDTKYIKITSWLRLALSFFLNLATQNKPIPTQNTPRIQKIQIDFCHYYILLQCRGILHGRSCVYSNTTCCCQPKICRPSLTVYE